MSRIPTWVIAVWAALCAGGAVLCWYFVLVAVAFGCDAGWQGCESAAMTALILYAVLAGGGLLALLAWAVKVPGVRIAVLFLMPLWVVAAVVLALGTFWLIAVIRT